MYRKTVIATITLLVAAIALSAWAFGATQNCYMAKERQSDDELNSRMLKKNSGASPESAAGAALQNDAQTATIEINDKGFEPSSLKLKAGAPAKVTFVRKTDATCAKEVVIKEYNINRNLPLNEPVTVEFTPRKGEFTFACGMDMIKGKLIVE
jgi:plastocyanin domain-containing protein